MSVVEDLARARAAYERRERVAAYEALSGAGEPSMLPDDFARLATTAFLLGRRNDGVQALQRAYKAHVDAGESLPAIRYACWLALVLITSGEAAVGSGWVARAERHLAAIEGDVVERGHLLLPLMFRHVFAAEFEQAYALAVEISEYGRRFDDADLLANGLNARGRMLI